MSEQPARGRRTGQNMPPILGIKVAQLSSHMKTKKIIITALILFGLSIASVFASSTLAQETAPVPERNAQALPTPETQPAGEPADSGQFFAQPQNEVGAADLLVRTGTYLALIIGMIVLMGLISKHLLRNGCLAPHKNRKIKILDSAFVEQKKHVYLVKVLDRAYVLASGANGGLSLIDKFDDLSKLDAEPEPKKTEAKKK